MGRGRCQPNARVRRGTGRTHTGCHFGIWQSGGRSTAAIDDEICRSCSRRWPTRLAQASSRTWRDPGGNITGFMLLEYSIGTKWLELLKDVEPRVTRVAVLRDPSLASGSGQFGAIQAVASSFGVELTPIGMRNASEIEDGVNAFARGATGGLIVTASTLATLHRELIVAIASRHRLPAVYSNRLFVTGGGLVSYSPDRIAQFRQAAAYIDRILKGEKPADLPVQAPTKYGLVDRDFQDRQGARPGGAADAARPRRRGDRVKETDGNSYRCSAARR